MTVFGTGEEVLNRPLQLHSLICHILLSTLQFDKQDLN